jgi:hypothetical protein
VTMSSLTFRLPTRNYHASTVFSVSRQSQLHCPIKPSYEYIGPEPDFMGGLFTIEAIRAAIPYGTFDNAVFRSRTTGRVYKLVCGKFRLKGSKHFNAAVRREGKEIECHQDH